MFPSVFTQASGVNDFLPAGLVRGRGYDAGRRVLGRLQRLFGLMDKGWGPPQRVLVPVSETTQSPTILAPSC